MEHKASLLLITVKIFLGDVLGKGMHCWEPFELLTQTLPGTALPSISEQQCTSPVSEERSLVACKLFLACRVFSWIKDLWLTKVGLLARGREHREGEGGGGFFLVKGHFTACCYHNNRLQTRGGGGVRHKVSLLAARRQALGLLWDIIKSPNQSKKKKKRESEGRGGNSSSTDDHITGCLFSFCRHRL